MDLEQHRYYVVCGEDMNQLRAEAAFSNRDDAKQAVENIEPDKKIEEFVLLHADDHVYAVENYISDKFVLEHLFSSPQEAIGYSQSTPGSLQGKKLEVDPDDYAGNEPTGKRDFGDGFEEDVWN